MVGNTKPDNRIPLFSLRKCIDDLYAAMEQAKGDTEMIAILNEQIRTQKEIMKEQWGVDR